MDNLEKLPIGHQIEMLWHTDSPTIGAIEQFFQAAIVQGALPNARVQVSADEGQYGKGAHCGMTIQWETDDE